MFLPHILRLLAYFIVAMPVVLQHLNAQSFTPVQFRIVGNASPGYIMVDSPLADSAGLLDHSGNWLHRFAAKGLTNFKIQPDGTISAYVEDSKFFLWNSNFEKIAELSADGYPTDFHDVTVLPGNKYLVMGGEYRTMNLSANVPGGQTNVVVTGFVLQERTFSGQTLWTWKSLDNIPVTEAADGIDLTQPAVSPYHPNSIYVDTDGNIMMSCRHLDRIIKINRQTGAIMWNLGGSASRKNDFTWLNDVRDGFRGFSRQHCVSRTANGDLMLFDNANMNPRQVSRAVIYRMNESAKTVERIWQYEHPFEPYCGSMGSALELPNGNILISWGNNQSNLLMSEVTRGGELLLDLLSPTTNGFQSYRAEKIFHRMAGAQSTIVAPATVAFSGQNGSTNLSLTATAVTKPTVVTVERHESDLPFGARPNPEPCRYLPVRWCIRSNNPDAIEGTLKFSLGQIPGLVDVTSVVMYHRAVEGVGLWNIVQGAFNEVTKEFVSTTYATGEYIVGSRLCFVPRLLEPILGQQRVTTTPRLVWSAAKNTKGYQIQLSTSNAFDASSMVMDSITTELELSTPRLESLTQYYWRARAINDEGPAAWSAIGRFSTSLGRPFALSPLFNGTDTVSVPTDAPLHWTAVNKASVYRVRVRRVDDPSVIVYSDSTALPGLTVRNLIPNTWFSWQVQAANDTVSSLWSDETTFLTSPIPPTDILPQSGTASLDHQYIRATWRLPVGALRAEVRIAVAGDNVFVVNREIDGAILQIPTLQPNRDYVWSIRSVGKYGRSLWSPEFRFSTAPISELGNAQLLFPLPAEIVGTATIHLSWYLPSAERFNVYVSTDSIGADIVHSIESLSDSVHIIPQGALENNKEYYWWVVAFDVQSGKTSTSERRRFEYRYGGPVIVGLRPISPFNGQANVPTEGRLLWTRDSRVSLYRAQVFDDKGEVVLSIMVPDTVVDYTGLRRGAQYSWRVLGVNSSGVLDSGVVARFTTVPLVSGVGEGDDASRFVSLTFENGVLSVNGLRPIGMLRTFVCTLDGRLVDIAQGYEHTSVNLTHLSRSVYIVVVTGEGLSAPVVLTLVN